MTDAEQIAALRAKQAEKYEELCLAYTNLFHSRDGQLVLADLLQQIDGPVYRHDDDPAKQPFIMAWREGRRSVWLLIRRMMQTYEEMATKPREEREIKVEQGSPFGPLDAEG